MSTRRRQQIGVYLEPEFFNAFMQLAEKHNVSASRLGRKIILQHLQESGVMPDEYIVEQIL